MQGWGIFCLEGEWDSDLRKKMSVRPLLTLLESLGIAQTIHRDVATRQELEYFFKKLKEKRYDDYKVVYLAMHGNAGCVNLGQDSVDLEDLAEMMGDSCAGRAVYFGSCLTLKGDDKGLQDFARRTKARAVVGYRKPVDWLSTAAFELLLLERMSVGWRSDALFNGLVKEHGTFAKSLGLVVGTRTKIMKVPLRQAAATH